MKLDEFNGDDSKEIMQALSKRNAAEHCTICNKKDFTLCKSDFLGSIRKESNGDTSILRVPVVSMFCNNCGNVRLHSLEALGF